MANDLPTPATNPEKFAAKAAGMDIETPTPVTNMEKYLDAIAKGGGGAITGQADWKQSDNTAPDYIKNKPGITDTATQSSADLITSGGVYTIVGNINAVLEEVL